MDPTQAADVLGIELPTEMRIAKKAYRNLAMLFHPDKGGDPEKFREIEAAYRLIGESPEHLTGAGDEGLLTHTVSGYPLSHLGAGFPISESAKQCDDCEGRGYTILREPLEVACPDCKGTGWKHLPCNRCGGSGKGNEEMPICPQCEGSGDFIPHEVAVKKGMTPKRGRSLLGYGYQVADQWPRSHYCPRCNGGKTIIDRTGKAYALECSECKGVGEVKMWNPVMPRGLLRG
jgi:DnaJ-class molecular chaperone